MRLITFGSSRLRLLAAALVALAVALSSTGSAVGETLTSELDLGDRTVSVSISYQPGNDAWAESVHSQVQSGVPTLERVTGFPYPGPDSIRIVELETEDIHGYAGTASCRISYCRITLTRDYDPLTLLHELGHLWTQPFGKRWLSEGYAEFVSLNAAEALGLYEDAFPDPYIDVPPPIPLSDWGAPINLLAATPDQELIEAAGYFFSHEFFRIVEDAVGTEALKAANATLFAEQTPYTVGSRLFMDTLEDTSGVILDDVFIEWVFPDDTTDLILQRREARSRLAMLNAQAEVIGLTIDDGIQKHIDAWEFDEALAIIERREPNLLAYPDVQTGLDQLREAVEEAGLPFPTPFANVIETWDFLDALDALPQAENALNAYKEAESAVAADRSLWQDIGLLGDDPDGKLASAASHFAAGRFFDSLADSRAAQEMIEGAEAAALRRLVIAVGVVAALGAAAAVAVWLLRPGPHADAGQA